MVKASVKRLHIIVMFCKTTFWPSFSSISREWRRKQQQEAVLFHTACIHAALQREKRVIYCISQYIFHIKQLANLNVSDANDLVTLHLVAHMKMKLIMYLCVYVHASFHQKEKPDF